MATRHALVLGCLAAVGGAGCPSAEPPGPTHRVFGPTRMSRAVVATLETDARHGVDGPRAAIVRPLLVPPECEVSVTPAGAALAHRIEVRVDVATTCALSFEFDDGRFRHRHDHTIRFLDVPTMRTSGEAHWLDACEAATRADHSGESIACEIGDEVIVTTGVAVERMPGRLRATDRAGGWVVCSPVECRMRDTSGSWSVLGGRAGAAVRWSPVRVPAAGFVGFGSEGSNEATYFPADGSSHMTTRAPHAAPTTLFIADGVLLAHAPRAAEDPWLAWTGSWESFEPAPAARFTGRLMEPFATVITATGGLDTLRVDEGRRRIDASPLSRQEADLLMNCFAEGVAGAAIALCSPATALTDAIELIRLTADRLEVIAIAPRPEPARTDRLATWLVTEDAVVVTPSDGSPPVHLRVAW